MKQLLRFLRLRLWHNWRYAQGLPPFPSPPGYEIWHQCVICGRKERLWEEPFIAVVGIERDGRFWIPDQLDDPFMLDNLESRDLRVICRDHGGEDGMMVIDANTGDEVQISPYRRRIKIYRVFREITWWLQVVARFAWYSFKELVFLTIHSKRYICWAKLLGGW